MSLHDLAGDIQQNTYGPDQLLEKLRDLLACVAFPCQDLNGILELLPRRTDENAAVLTLFEVELLLFYGTGPINQAAIDQKFKTLAPLSITNQLDAGSLTTLTRLKYHDLLTDYQYLVADSSLRLMELINKKLNFLSSLSTTSVIVKDVQLKILVFYLLSGSDFRKRNVQRYLSDEGVFEWDLDTALESFESQYNKKVIVPLLLYEALIAHLKEHSAPFSRVCCQHEGQLLTNFLDNNVGRLPKYFSSIRLDRMQTLFGVDSDYEDLVYRMIVAKKLPEGSTIDQMRGVVRFGEKPRKYDAFNSHIKQICELVDDIDL